MVNEDNSPDPDISIHSPGRSMPQFTGLALPTPLLELQRKEKDTSQPRHPSEFTALAARLRKIHLDTTPNSEAATNTPPSNNPTPMRLQFDDEDPTLDKENVQNNPAQSADIKPIKTIGGVDKLMDNPFLRPATTDSGEESYKELCDQADKDCDVVMDKKEQETTSDGRPGETVSSPSPSLQVTEEATTKGTNEIAIGIDPAHIEEVEDAHIISPNKLNEKSETHQDTDRIPTDAIAHVESANSEQGDAKLFATPQPQYPEKICLETTESSETCTQKEKPETATVPSEQAEDENSVAFQQVAENARKSSRSQVSEDCLNERATLQSQYPEKICLETTESSETCTHEEKPEPATVPSEQAEDENTVASEPVTESARESSRSQVSEDCFTERTQVSTATDKVANQPVKEPSAAQVEANDDTACHVESKEEELRANLGIVIEGESKWSWQKRCDAMREVTRVISGGISKGVLPIIAKALPDLSFAINANLDELRPSIMSAALNLTNAIILDKIDKGSDFAAQVFPSVMDLGCGRSITSQEGSRSVALLLDMHPELRSILAEADNPSRLQELFETDEVSKLVGEDVNLRAKKASSILRDTIGTGATRSPTTDNSNAGEKKSVDRIRAQKDEALSHSTDVEAVRPRLPIPMDAPLESPRFSTRSVNARFSQRLNAVSGSPVIGDDHSLGTAARRSLHLPAGGIRSTPHLPSRLGSEGYAATPLVKNMKLGNSNRKISPGSRSKRMYTEEDIEEARRAAMRVVMEEAAQAHAKEREKLLAEKADLEKQVAKEKSDVADLKSVLEEFELTMQKMVSEGNTQASAYCAALEKETKKLKAELLEATEAYEGIKERYDTGKQALKIYENKEARSIEQIRELKRNMAELQKWSDKLKANTEKKLTKAFENVTSYRASFLEMEARLSKAKSDLDRVRTEHEKEVANHKETASSLARVEKSLHSEQDARSSMEASLSATKATLTRMSVQKERMQRELSEAQDELKRVSSEASKLRDADVRAQNASKQLESYAAERQSLKARAYDDMNRIRELENALDSKDKEYNELNALAEEALSRLEKMKIRE